MKRDSRDRVILRALRLGWEAVGQGELEGWPNNSGPEVNLFRSLDGVRKKNGELKGPGGRGSWCGSFLSYCLYQAAGDMQLQLPFETSRGAKRLAKNIRKTGRALSVPEPGAVICWHRGNRGRLDWRGHIGFVWSYDEETRVLRVLQGNKGKHPAVVSVDSMTEREWRKNLFLVATITSKGFPTRRLPDFSFARP